MKKGLNAVLVALILLQAILFCASPPKGVSGEITNTLLDKVYQATNMESWRKNTEAVSFTWDAIGKHTYFWDKKRGLIEVSWDDLRVKFFKKNLQGIVYKENNLIQDNKKKKRIIYKAYKYFVNDSFWLNPIFHLDSPGLKTEYIDNNQLLVHFSEGGITPGDSYLFVLDENYLIDRMKMWVSVFPVKGISVDFENYIVTETGVKLALDHKTMFLNVSIKDLKMYSKYPFKGQDRFSELFLN